MIEGFKPECLAILEEAACKFYTALARKVKDPRLSKALEVVGLESKNHYEIIVAFFGKPAGAEDCRRFFGEEGFRMVEEMLQVAERLSSGVEVSLEEVASLLERFNSVEKVAGEEIYSKLYSVLIAEECKGLASLLMRSIASQEDFHYKVVEEVARTLRREAQANRERCPE
ncbi:ferritin family protein [Thermofilum pendens]|uniref:ferritin family protein n=1 Tax=Thermofilum pendens TaxID=2269 RepID=UPI00069C81B3|nr:ferritin family protein [Thermofilum pendens]